MSHILKVILTALTTLSSCAVIYNIPDVSDHRIFPYRLIGNAPDSIFYFERSWDTNCLGDLILTDHDYLIPNSVTLNEYLEGSKTAAFLIIRNDSILYEKYNEGYQESSLFNLFSVTKAFVTTLIGIAIDEGFINGISQPVTDFIPEVKDEPGFEHVSICHLLSHTSGIKFSTARYNPFSDNARYYYGHNLRKLALKSEIETPPGTVINYGSANVQLLAMILERSTGRTVSEYLQEKIWKEIGMQYNATWSLDSKRPDCIEKGFSCLNSTAIDMAKLGRLYLHNGKWQDKQILSEAFVHEAVRRDTLNGSNWNFQYNFRLGPKKYESYFSRGLYGQLIYVYPAKNLIIVRTGEADLDYNPQFLETIILQIIDQT